MSKNFEEEYKEYLNAQAPDLWTRIEAGVDALGAVEASEKVVPISTGKKAKKKRQNKYMYYRVLVSVAACLFALVLIVPVYFLTRNAGKNADGAAAEAPMMLADATIQNVEVSYEESTATTEDCAPMEEAASETTETDSAVEEMEESTSELAQTGSGVNDLVSEENGNAGDGTSQEQGQKGTQVATEETVVEEDTLWEDALEEEAVASQEQIQVTILGVEAEQEGSVVYTAVRADEVSTATISLLVSSDSGIVLETNKIYNVTVEMTEKENCYTVVAATE